MAQRESYGIDAPIVVRNLAVGGGAFLACSLLPRSGPLLSLLRRMWPSGLFMLGAAAWMLASSLWVKKIVMRSLLGERQWRGDETVLDVGCGRGLVAVAAARRVPRGKVHGIDLWAAKDLSGNNPDAIRANAALAGVADRLTIDSGDARELPYPDSSFDVVTSMTVIHNIPSKTGRQAAVAEAWRVLRPGGQMLIFDIRHARAYLRQVRELGAVATRLHGPIMLWGPIGWRFSATKPGG